MQTYKALLLATLGISLTAGCALFGNHVETTLQIHEQVSPALPKSHMLPVTIPKANLNLVVDPVAALSDRHILSAESYQTAGGLAIMLTFDIHGVILLDELTTRTRGEYLVTFLDGRPVAAWLVDRRITDGHLLVEGDFTDEQARKAIESLNRMSKKRR
jgi:preprotein translocase subunit SecD